MFINIDFLSELFYELSGKSHGMQSFCFCFYICPQSAIVVVSLTICITDSFFKR